MNWRRLAGVAMLAIFLGCASIPQKQSASQPAFAVEEANYNFQYAGPGKTISHAFAYVNNGRAPVAITGLSVCCGCEVQKPLPITETIAPGQHGQIIIKCTLPRFDGPVEKVVTLHTDKPDASSIPLTIKGEVRRGIVLMPSALYFGTLKIGQTAQKRLRMFQVSNTRLMVARVEADPDYYAVETIRFDEPNLRGYDIVVGFSANVPPGIHSDLLSIHTNDLRRPVIDVPIVANVIE